MRVVRRSSGQGVQGVQPTALFEEAATAFTTRATAAVERDPRRDVIATADQLQTELEALQGGEVA